MLLPGFPLRLNVGIAVVALARRTLVLISERLRGAMGITP